MKITIVWAASLVLVAGSCKSHEDERAGAEQSEATELSERSERAEHPDAPKVALADAIRVAAAHAPEFRVVAAGMTEGEEGSYTVALIKDGRVQEVVVDAESGGVSSTRERSVHEGMDAYAAKVEKALPEAKIDFARAIEIARARTANGVVLGAQVDFDGDDLVYGITLVDGETMMEVVVDSTSGEIASVREHTDDENGEEMEDESSEGDEPMDEPH